MGEYIFHPEHVHEFAMSYTATRAKEEGSKSKGEDGSDEYVTVEFNDIANVIHRPKAKRQKTTSGTYLGHKIFSYPKKFFDVLREMILQPTTIAGRFR